MQTKSEILIVSSLALLCAFTIIPGCAPLPQRADVEERVPADPHQAYDRGAYREAARLWEQQAVEAPETQASTLRLNAMDAWLLAGETGTARDMLAWIDIDTLSDQQVALLNLLVAEVEMENGNPVAARQRLDRVGDTLPEAWSGRYLALSTRVQTALSGLSTQSVRAAGELADEIRGYDRESALQLMRMLESVPSGQLAYLSELGGDPDRASWFDLAFVIRNNLVGAENLEHDVSSWKQRHPEHTVSAQDALDLWMLYRQDFQPPGKIAILLPDSGGLKRAGAAVRDGIISAYLTQPAGSEIHFYYTGSRPESVLAGYFDAADEGAELIIGPLAKPAVEALLGLAGLATPVLALNELPDGSLIPDGLEQQVFGMSLSQELEAVAISRRMTELGLGKVVVLAPETAWGDRISQAFQTDFLQQQGEILVASRYLPEENDHSPVLESILKIEESKARKQRLENRLQIELEFEPVGRSDVEGIFIAASPEQGRLLAPQLRFFDAGGIPTFTTSRVYSGKPDPGRNRDLNGLNVPMTPWQLEHITPESIPDLDSLLEGQFAPLFAIGIDAWNILPWLDLMRSDPDFRFPGESGTYSIAESGNLIREPQWGRFQGGTPVLTATDIE
jgi:outer membrane PBP1 activator LpoA protein